MLNTRLSLLTLGCCTALLGLPVAACGQGFYANFDLGGAFAQDVDLHRVIVPTPGAKLELDPGIRLSAAGGFNFNDYIGVQLETGLIYNEGENGDVALSHVPLMADVVFRCERAGCKFVPFVGIGAGGDVSAIALDHVYTPAGVVDGSAATLVFAWQAFGGVRYRFNDKMSVGANYKFFSANGASWDVEHTSGDIRSGTAYVHSVGVDFNLKF